MAVTQSSPDEQGSARCSELVNRSRGEEWEVARCSVEDGKAWSGVAAEKGTRWLLGRLLTDEETGRGVGPATVARGGEGGSGRRARSSGGLVVGTSARPMKAGGGR
jgi:hypothetical protein